MGKGSAENGTSDDGYSNHRLFILLTLAENVGPLLRDLQKCVAMMVNQSVVLGRRGRRPVVKCYPNALAHTYVGNGERQLDWYDDIGGWNTAASAASVTANWPVAVGKRAPAFFGSAGFSAPWEFTHFADGVSDIRRCPRSRATTAKHINGAGPSPSMVGRWWWCSAEWSDRQSVMSFSGSVGASAVD